MIEEEARCTFRPQINPASEQLLEDSLQVPANFYERQRFFYEMRQEKLQRLQTESVTLHFSTQSRTMPEPRVLHDPVTTCLISLMYASLEQHVAQAFFHTTQMLITHTYFAGQIVLDVLACPEQKESHQTSHQRPYLFAQGFGLVYSCLYC